ncbi:hypothetical protein GOODEAATRI_005829 [Goodea atripinnis]|uniref:Uncharacterized protein n=1 Tax=Goodea atripinnis TaxID=208336 RepID=A0ABV0PLC2_9TELE
MQYEDTQSQLLDLRQRYEKTEQEKLNIHQELEHSNRMPVTIDRFIFVFHSVLSVSLAFCLCSGTCGPVNGWSPWMPVIAAMVAVTAAVLYPNLSKSSAA